MDQALQARLDRNYRYQRHVYDLTREYYLLGRDRLIAELEPPARGAVLEIGCGTARNLVAVAARYPQAACYGVDLSTAMLETARARLRRQQGGPGITLALGDATSFDAQRAFGRSVFDRVFISYALSMIPAWREALAHSIRHVAPGGRLHIVDFGDGDRLPALANTALRAWLQRFHVTPRVELPEALTGLARRHGATLALHTPFRGYSILATLALPQARDIGAPVETPLECRWPRADET
ncbi:MAG: class I SAM-dependent methyltransferase [Hyphomicrobiaceae bacterium]